MHQSALQASEVIRNSLLFFFSGVGGWGQNGHLFQEPRRTEGAEVLSRSNEIIIIQEVILEFIHHKKKLSGLNVVIKRK